MLKDRIKGKGIATLLIPVSMSLYAILGAAAPAQATGTCEAQARIHCYQDWEGLGYSSLEECYAQEPAFECPPGV